MLTKRLQSVHAALVTCYAECQSTDSLRDIADLVAVLLEDFDDCMVAYARNPLVSGEPGPTDACLKALCGILERIYAHRCHNFEQKDALLRIEEACVSACLA